MLHRSSATTIAHVAQAAGVSKATVSLVLNGRGGPLRISAATRAAVADWAVRLGYQPNYAASSLRRRRANVITLLVWRLSSTYFSEIALAVRACPAAIELNLHLAWSGLTGGLDARFEVGRGARQRVRLPPKAAGIFAG